MSQWVHIFERHRDEHQLGLWGFIPESHFPLIAQQCGHAELEDIRSRLDDLHRQAAEIPDWDGDSHDDIQRAGQLFVAILEFHGRSTTKG